MDSTPPPMVMSDWPDMTWPAAMLHGLEAAGAEAVDLHARDRVRVVRVQHRDARDVGALLADRIDAAQHDVVDHWRCRDGCGRGCACSACVASSSAVTSCSAPSFLPLPRGVRTVS